MKRRLECRQQKLCNDWHWSAFGRCIALPFLRRIKQYIMSKKVEQLTSNLSLIEDYDQPLRGNALFDAVVRHIGESECEVVTIYDQKAVKFGDQILLVKAVSYLGNPHPIFKKRIQLPDAYQPFCLRIAKEHPNYDVRFIGVYHYNENIVFVDFAKETYLTHGLHNSSAHVYTNDIYQGMQSGVFSKIDRQGNTITVCRHDRFKDYLLGKEEGKNAIFNLFDQFNNSFPFGHSLYAMDKIVEMHDGGWPKWQETEWPGWYLEFLFDKYTKDNNLQHIARYISQKRQGELDFDIFFAEQDFYGDLKASDIHKKEAPGNDQKNVMDCLYSKHRLWYVIYEHLTEKDIDKGGVASAERARYINTMVPNANKREDSYVQKMKHSVDFRKMSIIEINLINYKEAFKNFAQGHQPDGSARAPKFLINKRVLDNDNFVIFRYNYQQA